MVKNFQRKMSQRLLGSLDQLARVGFGERGTQVLSSRLPDGLRSRGDNIMVVSVTGECVHVADEAGQVLVCDVRLETQLVLQGDGESQDEVHGSPISI